MVKKPTLNGVQRLKTQGTLDIGDVPKLALHDSAMPKVIAAMPQINIIILALKCCSVFKIYLPPKKYICKFFYAAQIKRR